MWSVGGGECGWGGGTFFPAGFWNFLDEETMGEGATIGFLTRYNLYNIHTCIYDTTLYGTYFKKYILISVVKKLYTFLKHNIVEEARTEPGLNKATHNVII